MGQDLSHPNSQSTKQLSNVLKQHLQEKSQSKSIKLAKDIQKLNLHATFDNRQTNKLSKLSLVKNKSCHINKENYNSIVSQCRNQPNQNCFWQPFQDQPNQHQRENKKLDNYKSRRHKQYSFKGKASNKQEDELQGEQKGQMTFQQQQQQRFDKYINSFKATKENLKESRNQHNSSNNLQNLLPLSSVVKTKARLSEHYQQQELNDLQGTVRMCKGQLNEQEPVCSDLDSSQEIVLDEQQCSINYQSRMAISSSTNERVEHNCKVINQFECKQRQRHKNYSFNFGVELEVDSSLNSLNSLNCLASLSHDKEDQANILLMTEVLMTEEKQQNSLSKQQSCCSQYSSQIVVNNEIEDVDIDADGYEQQTKQQGKFKKLIQQVQCPDLDIVVVKDDNSSVDDNYSECNVSYNSIDQQQHQPLQQNSQKQNPKQRQLYYHGQNSMRQIHLFNRYCQINEEKQEDNNNKNADDENGLNCCKQNNLPVTTTETTILNESLCPQSLVLLSFQTWKQKQQQKQYPQSIEQPQEQEQQKQYPQSIEQPQEQEQQQGQYLWQQTWDSYQKEKQEDQIFTDPSLMALVKDIQKQSSSLNGNINSNGNRNTNGNKKNIIKNKDEQENINLNQNHLNQKHLNHLNQNINKRKIEILLMSQSKSIYSLSSSKSSQQSQLKSSSTSLAQIINFKHISQNNDDQNLIQSKTMKEDNKTTINNQNTKYYSNPNPFSSTTPNIIKNNNYSAYDAFSTNKTTSFDALKMIETTFVCEQFSKGRYQGEKRNGLRNGFGTFYYNEQEGGGKYCGHWLDNKMSGYGTLYYSDTRIAYQGIWLDDSLHGKGILYNEQPNRFTQPYDYTNFDLCEDQDKWEKYQGWFMNDQKWGFGVLLLSNGERYIGQFQQDKVHGKGKFQSKESGIFEGRWHQNQLVVKY